MNIDLKCVGKKFHKEWIFRNMTCTFQQGHWYAIIGSNGTGKSTLLRILSGFVSPNEGTIDWTDKKRIVSPENVYKHITLAAPYLNLIDEMYLEELLSFHFSQKKCMDGWSAQKIIEALNFPAKRLLRDYSSGMKQRLKLALSFYTQSDMVLLDEPTTNLDHQGVEWYQSLLKNETKGRTVIVASNDEREYQVISHRINIETFKP